MKSSALKFILFTILLLGLPLLGVSFSGKAIGSYFQFPPKTQYVVHAPFSNLIFFSLLAFVIICLTPFCIRLIKRHAAPALMEESPSLNPFPLWGWLALFLGGIWWVLAWTRFDWFSALQKHTFTPLWIAYIVVMNAMIYRRKGHSPLLHKPGVFMALFGVSSVFWWFFEYLNRFLQNWYYEEVNTFSTFEYIVFASISFSTVLPAVLSTKEWLKTFPRVERTFRKALILRPNHPKYIAITAFFFASIGLTFVGVIPDLLFPLLWISPLIIISSFQALTGKPHVFSGIQRGDWTEICTWATAALLCGFFWEMWNYHSLARWVYSVPYVHRFQIFEMPFLGYFGYLPFGLECAVICNMVMKK